MYRVLLLAAMSLALLSGCSEDEEKAYQDLEVRVYSLKEGATFRTWIYGPSSPLVASFPVQNAVVFKFDRILRSGDVITLGGIADDEFNIIFDVMHKGEVIKNFRVGPELAVTGQFWFEYRLPD